MYGLHGVRGFCIGSADLVPGVSGSTVAVLFGVYERLLDAVHRVARAIAGLPAGRAGLRRARERLAGIEWTLSVPVALGAVVAVLVLPQAIDWLLEHRPEATAGAFFGLVLAAVIVAVRGERPGRAPAVADSAATRGERPGRAPAAADSAATRGERSWRMPAVAVCVAVAVGSGRLFGLSATPLAEPALAAYFGAGVLGACAMVLPGISGSFVLLMIGVYAPFIEALSDRHWTPVAVLGAGALVGGLAFSTVLRRLLARYRAPVMAVLVGLMLGSLRVLWPWPHGVGILGEAGETVSGTALHWPSPSEALWPAVWAAIAFTAALTAARLANRTDSTHRPTPADPAAGTA